VTKRSGNKTFVKVDGRLRKTRKGVPQGGPLSPILREQGLISIKELWVNIYLPQADSLSGYSPISFVKRPVRTRIPGIVGAEGDKPPATRLGDFICKHVLPQMEITVAGHILLRQPGNHAVVISPSI